MPLKKHKHHDVIVKWAEGFPIQIKVDGKWLDCVSNPVWYPDKKYRVKPKPSVPTYQYLFASLAVPTDVQVTRHHYRSAAAAQKQLDRDWANRYSVLREVPESLLEVEGEYE